MKSACDPRLTPPRGNNSYAKPSSSLLQMLSRFSTRRSHECPHPDNHNAHPRTIDIVSDVICPWCFIGKRRLEKALTLLGNPAGVAVTWKPFQLNPQMPPQGIERRQYRIAKFGSWERSQALDAQ